MKTCSVFTMLCIGLCLSLAACDRGKNRRGGDADPALVAYSVGGVVSGLNGTLVLQNNAGDNLTLAAGGNFAFATTLNDGSAYLVSVLTQPGDQDCTVAHGAGAVNGANITSVQVACADLSGGGGVASLAGPILVTPLNAVLTVGQLQLFSATGTFSDASTETLGPAITAVATGQDHSCALLTGGTVECWGNNTDGQLGNGATLDSAVPVAVSGIDTATAIAAGRGHSCALLAGGTVACWGNNAFGQLGNGTVLDSATPVIVGGIGTAVALALGGGHSCAVLAGGTVQCWGDNADGQLGNGTRLDSVTPVAVSGISTAIAVATGQEHSCAMLAGGAVACWGDNAFGQLGNGTTSLSTTPVTVTGIGTATAIVAGQGHNCALFASGVMQCWGRNAGGELGNGTTTDAATPVTVGGISTAIAIAAGEGHSCAVLASGAMRCWGRNASGQLGNGTTTDTAMPVTVAGIGTGVAIAGGGGHYCGLLADGALLCWGSNSHGQLATGVAASSSIPLRVTGTPGVVWNSSDPAVATVDAAGEVTAAAAGTTDISATAGAIHGEAPLTVNAPSYSLSVVVTGTGSGTVTGAGTYTAGQIATLGVVPDLGSTFGSWTNANAAECATGAVEMNTDKVCTAVFTLNPPLGVTTTSLSGGVQGSAYSAALSALGGAPPYAWSLTAGSLPAGLTLTGSGVIVGTPTTAGTFNITVRATDLLASADDKDLSLVISPPLLIDSSGLLYGYPGVAYNHALTASNGEAPYVWALTAGGLPPGLSMSSNGLVSGTPAATGTFGFTVQVTDAQSRQATRVLSMSIVNANTPAGTNVLVERLPVVLTFDQVTVPGTTNVKISNNQSLPKGFRVNARYYEVTTTASFTGNIQVCILYSDLNLTAEQENALLLYHASNGVWEEITASLDTATNFICGYSSVLP